jgi:antitoxin (DNA-binding transcriptional repressor) of toxin-antitoxin stability system
MHFTVALEEIRVSLAELRESLTAGDEVILTRDQQPVARLVSELPKPRQPRKAGNCIGMIKIVADDEEHLADFAEYI